MPNRDPWGDPFKSEKKVRRSRRRGNSKLGIWLHRWLAKIEPWPDPAAWGEEEELEQDPWYKRIYRRWRKKPNE